MQSGNPVGLQLTVDPGSIFLLLQPDRHSRCSDNSSTSVSVDSVNVSRKRKASKGKARTLNFTIELDLLIN